MADRHPSRNRRGPHVQEAPPTHEGLREAALTCQRCGAHFDTIGETVRHVSEEHLGPRERVEPSGDA